jgi:hypothetical protein
VRWVKRGREVGYVPIHPRDVAGKLPINLKDGIFKPTKKGDSIRVERVNFKEGKPVELMKMNEAPKEFRKPVLQTLERAEVPHAMAYSASRAGQQLRGTATDLANAKGTVKTGSATDKGTATASLPIAKGTGKTGFAVEAGLATKQPGTPITFDRKRQSFSVARPVNENGRQSTAAVPLGGGWNGTPAARGTTSYGGAQNGRTATSNGGGTSRSYSPAPSNNSGSGNYSRPSAPAPSYSPPARSYSPPAQSYSPPAQSYSRPAETHSAPAPSNNGGGASGSNGGAAHR